MPLNPVGNSVLIVVDIQGGDGCGPDGGEERHQLSVMSGRTERMGLVDKVLTCCRAVGIPCIFIEEVHKPILVDIGRELDGAEGPHCVEGWAETELASFMKPTKEEFVIKKRRYSAFFGTELLIVLKAYKAQTVLLVGGMTDVCVMYTAVNAHQHDYNIRVLSDCVGGSSKKAHDAALDAMLYLQHDAWVTAADILKYADELEAEKKVEE